MTKWLRLEGHEVKGWYWVWWHMSYGSGQLASWGERDKVRETRRWQQRMLFSSEQWVVDAWSQCRNMEPAFESVRTCVVCLGDTVWLSCLHHSLQYMHYPSSPPPPLPSPLLSHQSSPFLLYSPPPYVSYPILSYPILSSPLLSYPILTFHFLSYPILSYSYFSFPLLSNLYLPSPLLPYPILPYTFFSFYLLNKK